MEVIKIDNSCVCQTFKGLCKGTPLLLLLKGASAPFRITFDKFIDNCIIGIRDDSPIIIDCDCICSIGITPSCVETTSSFTNPTSITIPDLSQGVPYPSPITVTGLNGNILKVTVVINNFSHTFPDDVGILLVGPGGQNVDLLDCAGGGTNAVNATLTFDDNAPSQIVGPVVSGTFQPSAFCNRNYNLSAPTPPFGSQLLAFNGTNPNGAWSLYVQDFVGGDVGIIDGGWTLNITSCES
ncbi:proprotein convertase P-domain-containing protein [Fictibacillus sp. 5RED26]|uniref:proprotein convertase P-domain-containing protein n=1 Tax=Fictibacillus sp. 5RED26 TaxID=2745876 RepID=UPI0018CD734C|nr:proprotein convertase P-domain-containing protein [Fictibacillus sp. 5RED26]MBH0158623.1 proprotein convertase P-domain-containing protein [Fictibacillus sp. 5RED26]